MTRRVHTTTRPRRETSKARQAFNDYAALPAGERSLAKLLERYHHRAESPPTRSLKMLKEWSSAFAWQARIALREGEEAEQRRAERQRILLEQARQDAALARQVGSGALAVAALALTDLADPATGTLKRPIAPRELAPIVKAALDCLSWAYTGVAPDEVSDPQAALRKVLDHADGDTKHKVVAGMSALMTWAEEHKGR